MTKSERLVVIGSSWGGLNALTRVLGPLPASLPAAVAVAQHRGTGDPDMLAPLLARRTALRIEEADDKMQLQPGAAYLAPAGYHLLVEDSTLALSTEATVNHSRPSIDVLFQSAAESFGERAIAILLTGANEDGAEGMRRVASRGGRTCVQDPEEAERSEMPRAALAVLTPDAVLALDDIPAWIEESVAQ